MKLGRITLVTLTLVGTLFWKPVRSMPNHDQVCPLSTTVNVSVLALPPFAMLPSSGEGKGILGDFFHRIVQNCVLKQCNLTIDSIQVTTFNNTRNLKESLETGKAEIAFPLSRPLKMMLSGEDYVGPALILEQLIKSPGYSLIMDVGIFNGKANDIVLTRMLQNIWPIIVFTILLAGISGICVWILVSRTSNIYLKHQSRSTSHFNITA